MQAFIDKYLFRDRRIKIITTSVVVLALVQQIIGWTFIPLQYVYKTSDCTLYLTGFRRCDGTSSSSSSSSKTSYSSYYYNYYYGNSGSSSGSSSSTICSESDYDCDLGYQIIGLFIGGTVYPLLQLFYMGIFSWCHYRSSQKNHNYLRCAQIFWIICYFSCMVGLFQNATNVAKLRAQSIKDVNMQVGEACKGMGVLCLFIFLMLIGLTYDLHQQIKQGNNTVQPVSVILNQQPGQTQSHVIQKVIQNGPQNTSQQLQGPLQKQQSLILPMTQSQIQILPQEQPYQQYQPVYGQAMNPQVQQQYIQPTQYQQIQQQPQAYAQLSNGQQGQQQVQQAPLQQQVQQAPGQQQLQQVPGQQQVQIQQVTIGQVGQAQVIQPIPGQPLYIQFSKDNIIKISPQ